MTGLHASVYSRMTSAYSFWNGHIEESSTGHAESKSFKTTISVILFHRVCNRLEAFAFRTKPASIITVRIYGVAWTICGRSRPVDCSIICRAQRIPNMELAATRGCSKGCGSLHVKLSRNPRPICVVNWASARPLRLLFSVFFLTEAYSLSFSS
jgi:hypothetical protein